MSFPRETLRALPGYLRRLDKPRAWLERHGRSVALFIILVLCVNGIVLFALGDHSAFLDNWRTHAQALGLGVLCAFTTIVLDGLCWALLMRQFGVNMFHRWGACIFLSAYAATLLPLKLGRLIRPDAVGRLKLGGRLPAVQVEGVMLMFEAFGAAALFTSMIAFQLNPWFALFTGLAVTTTLFATAHALSEFLVGTRLALPARFWFTPYTWLLFLLIQIGWLLDGLILFMLLREAPGDLPYNQVLAITLGSLVAGSGSGLPGGVGVVEGLIGVSLALLEIPGAFLAFAITGYRIIALWLWVPMGWVCLILIQRKEKRLAFEQELLARIPVDGIG